MSSVCRDTEKLTLLIGSKFLRAYLECGAPIQEGIRDMLDILQDPNTSEDDREMTLFTLADALFPDPHDGEMGMELSDFEPLAASELEEARQVLEEMDQEEANFADRLRKAMAAKGVTQEMLAARLGIGQPAISNILNRTCRPQRRTVLRLAKALEIAPAELWPGIEGS